MIVKKFTNERKYLQIICLIGLVDKVKNSYNLIIETNAPIKE